MAVPLKIGFSSSLVLAVASISLIGTCVALFVDHKRKQMTDQSSSTNSEIRIAFCGNSMLYYNDSPNLIQQMIQTAFPSNSVLQDSCLRGGATLRSLFQRGNGMGTKFGPLHEIGQPTVSQLLSAKHWNFVVLNDHTQHPTREASASESRTVLGEVYAALMKGACPIIIQTPAYRKAGIKNSSDLGDFDAMTDHVRDGVMSYLSVLPNNARVAPVGEAYRVVRKRDIELWKRLYSWDDFHPSPYGTWLQACVVFCVCFGQRPPNYNAQWWEKCRYMQPPNEKPLPLPTDGEAMELLFIACVVTGVRM